MENQEKVDAKIKELDSQFDFVILAEFFDEGLVILAKLLCWDLEDVRKKQIFLLMLVDDHTQVRYLKQNARTASKVNNITAESREALEVMFWFSRWVWAPFILCTFHPMHNSCTEMVGERLQIVQPLWEEIWASSREVCCQFFSILFSFFFMKIFLIDYYCLQLWQGGVRGRCRATSSS